MTHIIEGVGKLKIKVWSLLRGQGLELEDKQTKLEIRGSHGVIVI